MKLPNTHAWRCDCGGGHFLTFWWEPNDADATFEGNLGIEGDNNTTLRDRVVQAWRHIRNGCSATRVGVIVDRQTATEIRDAMNEFLAADTAEATPGA